MDKELIPNGNPENGLLEMEIDAIGEILNISMGSAATALSSMLDKKVIITTPKVSVKNVKELDYSDMEPAMIVKITYIKGITGSNVMMFRQRDMQIILNQLMGIDEEPRDDYVFDEMSISAACEVMNQMMGASSTALSEFLGRSINISIPTASIIDGDNTFEKLVDIDPKNQVVVTVFDLDIDGAVNTEFFCILSLELSKMIVNQFMGATIEDAIQEPAQPELAQPEPTPQAPMADVSQSAQPQQPSQPPQPAQFNAPQNPYLQMGQFPNQPMYPMYYPPYGYPGGYPQMPPQMPPQQDQNVENQVLRNPLNVHQVQFPDFSGSQPVFTAPLTNGNIDMLMNVPLNVSIEIGRTKRKIRDIMDFNQGSIIELEKQAGAPVDIVVNDQLIARGDVVVIDDNFAVRVTEIIGTKDLITGAEAAEK